MGSDERAKGSRGFARVFKDTNFNFVEGKGPRERGNAGRVTAERGTGAGRTGTAQQGNGYGVNSATKKAKKFTTAPQKQQPPTKKKSVFGTGVRRRRAGGT